MSITRRAGHRDWVLAYLVSEDRGMDFSIPDENWDSMSNEDFVRLLDSNIQVIIDTVRNIHE